MLQHRSGAWSWGRYVVVHAAGNVDFADTCTRYRDFLADEATFSSVTVEGLLDSGVLPTAVTAALRARYVSTYREPRCRTTCAAKSSCSRRCRSSWTQSSPRSDSRLTRVSLVESAAPTSRRSTSGWGRR